VGAAGWTGTVSGCTFGAGVFVEGLPSETGCGMVTERVPVAGSDSTRRP
jgi:hypothetical protein